MEHYLQEINKNFISLSDSEIKMNNQILHSVLDLFIEKMKEKDPLFDAMFRGVFYGGSFYDGLRIGKPSEFDLDLLLRIPKRAEPVISTSNNPGFVHLQVKNLPAWMRQPEAKPAYNNFERLLLDERNYLSTQKVLIWMESVVQKVLNGLPTSGSYYIFQNHIGTFEISPIHKGGPAMTLYLRGNGIEIDVDLVACFVFKADKWPRNGFRANPVSSKPKFFIVPKSPKHLVNEPVPRYWRLSFQEQERVLIDNKLFLKPAAKLLKRLRDNLEHKCIASYYIKTVLLHMVDQKDDQFWRNPLSHVFMTVLREYKGFIEKKNLPYYWYKNNNLLRGIDDSTLNNINNRLRNVIRDLENRPETVLGYLGERKRSEGNSRNSPIITNEEASRCIVS